MVTHWTDRRSRRKRWSKPCGTAASEGEPTRSLSGQTKEVSSDPSNCVKVEVDVLGFSFLMVRKVSVDVKQH